MIGLVAIFSSLLLLIVGALPWFREGLSSSTIANAGAMIVPVLGIVLFIPALLNQLKKKQRFGLLFQAIGIISLLVALLQYAGLLDGIGHLIHNRIDKSAEFVPLHYSLFEFLLVAVVSIAVIMTGMQLRKMSNSISYAQSTTAAFVAGRVAFNQQKSFSRFIIRLATVATVISVMVMIVTLSLANGFQEKVSQKVFSFLGHIRIQEKQPGKAIISEEIPIDKNDRLAEQIRSYPGVTGVYPFATKYAALKTKEDLEGVLIKGVDSTYDFNRVSGFMQEGRPIHFNDSTYSREIMLSAYTAKQLKLHVNDRILIYFLDASTGEEGAGFPSSKVNKLTVAGIYKTGIEDYDKTFAIADMKMIQRLNADSVNSDDYKKKIGGYEVFIDNYKDTKKIANGIYEQLDFPITWDTVTAGDISQNIFDWLNMQDTTRNVLIIFMVIVAVINLITCLIILVLERIRMIGILKSLGASDWTVQQIFLRHSALITITGIVVGTALGLGLLWLQQATGFIRLKEEAYYISEAAVKIIWWQVGLVCFATFVVCFLIMMIPSILVRKVQPVQAIHFR